MSGPSVLQVVRPSAGGIRTHVQSLSRGLIERGWVVSIAAPPGLRLVTTFPFHPVAIPSRAHPSRDLLAAVQVSRLARNVDLLHGHGLRGAWIAALASSLSRKPFVFTAHNLLPPAPGPVARMSLRYVCRSAAADICVSNAIADGLRKWCPGGHTIEVIPNGIDIAAYRGPVDRAAIVRELGLPPAASELTARWVAGVGRLSHEKGFDILIRAAANVRGWVRELYVIIAGDGPERSTLLEQGQLHGLEGVVMLPGFVRDIPMLLRCADIVVIPSRQEGQGIVALEAMASGTPVVYANVGGLPETLGNAGIMVPPEDPHALSDACVSLLGSDMERSNLSRMGLSRVEANYTVERMVRRTEEVYRTVLAPRG